LDDLLSYRYYQSIKWRKRAWISDII
jgi:hypothetical protein